MDQDGSEDDGENKDWKDRLMTLGPKFSQMQDAVRGNLEENTNDPLNMTNDQENANIGLVPEESSRDEIQERKRSKYLGDDEV